MIENKMDNPLISIIVPIYKVEKYLEKCLNSILNQTYQKLELILVDDGSPDNCGEICDSYKVKDSRVRVIHKENGGLSAARNAGIDIALGEFIGFVDSDDYIEADMYEALFRAININKCKLSVCNINYVFEDGKIFPKASKVVDELFDFEEAIVEMNTYRLFDMGAWSKLYHRSLFENLRFPEGKLSEDFYIMYKIFERAKQIAYVAKHCYNYLQRQNSISRNKKINHDFEYAALEQMEFLDKRYPDLKIVGHTAYASAVLTVFDFYIKNKVRCPKETIQHMKNAVKDNLIYIKQAKFLKYQKKIQFKLFNMNPFIYSQVFIIYRKIKRV